MSRVWADFLNWAQSPGGSVLVGAVIGAAGAVLGGLGGALLVDGREDRRRHADHVAAVRAVEAELLGNRSTIATAHRISSLRELALSVTAYDSLLLPLYSELPAEVADMVSKAYAWVKTTSAHPELAMAVPRHVVDAHEALLDYANDHLGLDLPAMPARDD